MSDCCLRNVEKWTKNIITEIAETEFSLRTNEQLTGLDKEYMAGSHDRTIILLDELGVEHDFQFCHKDEY